MNLLNLCCSINKSVKFSFLFCLYVLFLSLQISGKEKKNILRQGPAKYDNLLLWIFHASVQLCHLKLQQKLHYRTFVPSLKITSLIFWVNITYNAYCYGTINALALMLMLMFSVYLNNFPQHKKRSESVSVPKKVNYVFRGDKWIGLFFPIAPYNLTRWSTLLCKSEWFFSSSECSDACSITICAGVEGVSGPSYILNERERGLDTTIWKYEFKYYLSICPP